MMKKILVLFCACSLLLILMSNASAEINYNDNEARISSRSHNLNHITDKDFVEVSEDGKTCYVKKSIRVLSTGTLRISPTSCENIKLYSNVTITIYGRLYIDSVKITSYDPVTEQPIELSRTNYDVVRPDIVTRSSAQYVSIKNSELAYLGYYNATSSHWGVALRFLPKAYIYNSDFHHNYFGFYTFDSDHVTVINSKFHDNLEYGINIHDFSDNFYAYNNDVYNNGNHGIILSKYNENGKLINNRVSNHTQNAFVKGVVKDYGTHGIILHKQSNNALLSRNELTNNREGITLQDSHNNEIKTNYIVSDLEEGFVIRDSSNNEFKYNRFYQSEKESLYSLNSFDNFYYVNRWYDTDNTVYVKIEDGENVSSYRFPADYRADERLNELASPPSSQITASVSLYSSQGSFASPSISTFSTNENKEEIEEVIENENFEINFEREREIKVSEKNNRNKKSEKEFVDKVKDYEEKEAKKLEKESRDLSLKIPKNENTKLKFEEKSQLSLENFEVDKDIIKLSPKENGKIKLKVTDKIK